MADAPEQPTPDPPTPPQEAIQMPKKNKKGRRKKPKKAAAAAAAPSSSGATMVEDPFLVLAGGKEGGFLELEEIDGADFGIFGSFVEDVGASEKKAWNDQKKKKKKKKRKRGDAKRLDGDVGGDGDGDGDCAGDLVAESEEEGEKGENKRKRKKRNKKKRKVKDNDSESKEDVADDNVEDMQDDIENMEQDNKEEVKLGEDELYAWLELRLHPLLIKAMHRLGFNEPTPIQKACIPAGAHQGKDVIGAAETGSGKTLAFGLPILQRLLEERDKTTRLHVEDEKVAEGSSTGGPLRALILTPTRELAKQVCDHLKEAAKFLGIHVVPIVGGLSMEKQERLLKKKPEIFLANQPKSFSAYVEAMDTDDLLVDMKTHLECSNVRPEDYVKFTSFQLKDQAADWYQQYKDFRGGRVISWTDFYRDF
ncbi:DEAD-box ATP-dependent RNA helicase 13-like [Triticum urartu]|uniref:DEAD-box ATP-dependent RNA helicase 13-like n=1 Tax=Triticum urartu TaxID=4572 RepID=UPI0020432923|nr:DEAD-box ATP-dependent RNA helicase 13-like [Triticum urartu]